MTLTVQPMSCKSLLVSNIPIQKRSCGLLSRRIFLLHISAALRAHAPMSMIVKFVTATGTDLIQTVLAYFIHFIIGFICLYAFFFHFTFHFSNVGTHVRITAFRHFFFHMRHVMVWAAIIHMTVVLFIGVVIVFVVIHQLASSLYLLLRPFYKGGCYILCNWQEKCYGKSLSTHNFFVTHKI